MGGREGGHIPPLFDHQYEQNSELSSSGLQLFLLIGFGRWKHKVGRLSLWRHSSKDSNFLQHVLWCLCEEDLAWIWVGKKITQKRTWFKLTFLYYSTLLLSNPSIVSAFIFCSAFTYIQYYIVEKNGKMQVNSSLFYTLYIGTPTALISVVLRR